MSPHDSFPRPPPRRSNSFVALGGNNSLSTISGSSSTTTTTTLEPFPVLTHAQHVRLDEIIGALEPGAKSWAEFKRKKEEIESINPHHSEDDSEGEEEEDIYPISLKLVFQPGITWKEKWNNVQHSQQTQQSSLPLPPPQARTATATRNGGLDRLREKMDRVSLSAPELPRSKSTPPTHRTTQRRDFLVERKSRHSAAFTSSSEDEYVGVPSLQDLALARRRRIQQQQEEQRKEEQEEEKTPKSTPIGRLAPIQSTPPRRPSTSSTKHPLLERRLAELGLNPPSSSPNPSPSLVPPSIPVPSRQSHPSNNNESHLASLESRAIEFNRLHLLSSHFDSWSSLFSFNLSRSRSVQVARDHWLLRCSLQDWVEFTKRLGLLREREREWNERREKDGSLGRNVVRKWRERLRGKLEERRKEERERELKEARNQVVSFRNERLLRQTLQTWKLSTLESLAFHFRLRYLPLHQLRHWKRSLDLRRAHQETLESVATEVWDGHCQRVFGGCWEGWKKKMRMRRAERIVIERRGEGTRRGVIEVWKGKTREKIHLRHLESLALEFSHRRLLSTSLSTWTRRYSFILTLSHRADSHRSLVATPRLLKTSLKTWILSTNASRFYSSRSSLLAKNCLSQWISRLDHLELELHGLANQYLSIKNQQLLRVVFSAWTSSTSHSLKLNTLAVKVSASRDLRKGFERWRERVREVELGEKKATVVREFFLQRKAFRRWSERVEEGKRRRWGEERRRRRKKEVVEFWNKRTRQVKEDRGRIEVIEKKNRKNTLKERLSIWKEQVILRKELERESTILCETRLAQSVFERWISRTVQVANLSAKAEKFREIKDEELRDSVFQKWHSFTRRSLVLRKTLSERLERKRVGTLEESFGKWREKRLSPFEEEVRERIREGTRKAVLEKWTNSTITLTALRTYRYNLLARSLITWKRWTPSPSLVAQAIEHDETALKRCSVIRWSLKTSFRRAFRNTSGRLSAPRSLPSPSSTTAAASYERIEIESPTSPSPSIVRPGLPPSLSTLSSPTSHLGSLSTASQSTPATTVPPVVPPSLPFLRRNNSSSSFSYTNRTRPERPERHERQGHRPKLSADYQAPLPPLPRTRPRRRSSLASLGARSAPAVPIDTGDSEDEEEEEEGTRYRARSEVARSEGGGAGVRRDVRKGFEALRERLRVAAENSRGR